MMFGFKLGLVERRETVLKSIGLQLPGRVGSLIKTSEPAESEENAFEHAMRRLCAMRGRACMVPCSQSMIRVLVTLLQRRELWK